MAAAKSSPPERPNKSQRSQAITRAGTCGRYSMALPTSICWNRSLIEWWQDVTIIWVASLIAVIKILSGVKWQICLGAGWLRLVTPGRHQPCIDLIIDRIRYEARVGIAIGHDNSTRMVAGWARCR